MKLKPFKEIIGMSKEKLSEALAPIRARNSGDTLSGWFTARDAVIAPTPARAATSASVARPLARFFRGGALDILGSSNIW